MRIAGSASGPPADVDSVARPQFIASSEIGSQADAEPQILRRIVQRHLHSLDFVVQAAAAQPDGADATRYLLGCAVVLWDRDGHAAQRHRRGFMGQTVATRQGQGACPRRPMSGTAPGWSPLSFAVTASDQF